MQQKGEKEKIGNFFKNRKPQSGKNTTLTFNFLIKLL